MKDGGFFYFEGIFYDLIPISLANTLVSLHHQVLYKIPQHDNIT